MANKRVKRLTKKYYLFLLLLFIATIFMGIGYASYFGVLLDIDGEARVLTQDVVHISAASYSSDNGANVSQSSINNYFGTTLNSKITLGSNSSSTITYSITIVNDTNDNYIFTGTSFDPDFYDNNNIIFNINGLSTGYELNPNGSKTFTITFSYAGSNTSNPVLNSYISFDFEKYYTITYTHINTSGHNYPTYILDSETTKSFTFSGDVPADVSISPTVNYSYNDSTGTLTLNNVKNNITIDRYYKITYNLDGGTNNANNPAKYLHGAALTISAPTKANETFDGWFNNSSFTGTAITSTNGLSGDLTLYAKWIGAPTTQVATTYITSLVENADPTSTDVITLATPTGATCTNLMAYDGTSDSNLRYVGADPCNYVKFNCDSNGSNCEIWRIVGVMNGVGSNPLVRLAAPLSSSTTTWNSSNNKVWSSSALNNTLNSTFLNGLKTGVQSDFLENGTWFSGVSAYTANAGTSYTNGKATTNTAYVGMLSTADYGLASAGGGNTPRSTCITTAMNSFPANCYNNDWLFQGSSLYQWTLTPQNNGNSVHRITTGGVITRVSPNQNQQASNYRPMVFLKSGTKIDTTSGDGSSQNPYVLVKGN